MDWIELYVILGRPDYHYWDKKKDRGISEAYFFNQGTQAEKEKFCKEACVQFLGRMASLVRDEGALVNHRDFGYKRIQETVDRIRSKKPSWFKD